MKRLHFKAKTLLQAACITAFTCQPSLAFSEDFSRVKELLDQPFEALFNQEISISSRRPEKTFKAQGIVNIISADEIKRYGGNNLFDVLSRLPNVAIIKGVPLFLSNFGLNFRGQTLKATDAHNLILINGRPARESQFGSWTQAFYNNIPLETIHHIEVIRGPGSVLYGTNAFSSVINIVTKPAGDKAEKIVSVGYGSFNTRNTQMSYRQNYKDLEISTGLKLEKSDGWDFAVNDATSTFYKDNLGYDQYGAIANLNYKNWRLNTVLSKTKIDTFGVFPVAPFGSHKQQRNFIDLGYQHPLNDRWKVEANITYNGLRNYALDGSNTVADNNNFNDMLYETALSGHLTENLNFLAGINYADNKGSLKAGGGEYRRYTTGTYFQFDHSPSDKLNLVYGLQINKVEDLDYDFSPRIGAVYQFTSNVGAKLHYGEAFRSASASETNLQIPGVIGNPDLEPEKIKTFDGQLFYKTNSLFAAATYYHSDVKNVIFVGANPDVASPFPFTFLNGTALTYDGIELEGEWRPYPNWEFKGSSSYQWGKDKKTGDRDVTLTPHFMLKAGFSYHADNGLTLSAFDQYYGDTIKSVPFSTSPPISNPRAGNYNIITANLSMDVNKFAKLGRNTPQMTWSLYIDNLLDEDIYILGLTSTANSSMPGYSSRAFYSRLKFEF